MESVRLDKWLWAARFFKTRNLARTAIEGGRVHVNSGRTKPARPVRVGDRLEISRGEIRWEVVVAGLSDRRGPAEEAQHLYAETERSLALREKAAEERRAKRLRRGSERRPSKRDRRELSRLKRGGGET